jgi:hypothetical protein
MLRLLSNPFLMNCFALPAIAQSAKRTLRGERGNAVKDFMYFDPCRGQKSFTVLGDED